MGEGIILASTKEADNPVNSIVLSFIDAVNKWDVVVGKLMAISRREKRIL
jgi:hypothetical protein